MMISGKLKKLELFIVHFRLYQLSHDHNTDKLTICITHFLNIEDNIFANMDYANF